MTNPQIGPDDLFVAPDGNDEWSGTLPEPNAGATDGPLATVAAARDRIRSRKGPPPYVDRAWAIEGLSGPVTVWLRGGRYPLTEPIVFTPQDSGPIAYRAYHDETPILDGGRRIGGWRIEQVNQRTCWVVDLPEVAAGEWNFRQLFADGRRRPRARLPKKGVYRMQDVPGLTLPAAFGTSRQDAFIAAEGQFANWRNLTDVEVVALHWWIEERFAVVSFDPQTRLVKLARTSRAPLADDRQDGFARYYVEHVFEALTEPGEWYLDRPAGRLYYLPMPGEDPETTEVFAPRALQLLRLDGDPDQQRFVEYLRFEGLTFQHSDWRHPGENGAPVAVELADPSEHLPFHRGHDAAASQAACDVPGVVSLRGARHCGINNCTVRNVGWYGIELGDGCCGNRIVGNEIADTGGGGIRINGAEAGGPMFRRTGYNRITDNHVHDGGRIFHSAVGILSMHSAGNVIAHNHVHRFYYTGISCGWVWGYMENVSRDNLIEHNHIHDLGGGGLSDMGGIYLLGVQPGTVVRGNLIHDLEMANYGGWGIYPDQGSSHLVIEHNLCYRTNSQVFHQHFGRENIVRNNIFALGRQGGISLGRTDNAGRSMTFLRNIVVTDAAPIFVAGYRHRLEDRRMVCDLNLYWDRSGPPTMAKQSGGDGRSFDWAQWRAIGYDLHSLVADPRFSDPEADDFSLADDSPVWQLGFEPIDLSDVGPRAAPPFTGLPPA